jgi:hypothetical protein
MASPGLLSALQQGMPLETYYNNIRNFAASARSPQELVAAAQQLGISGEDIMNATGEMPLSAYDRDSNPMNLALAQALESIPTTINTGVQFNQQTRDVDQGVAAQSNFNVVNPRTGQMENVTPASEVIPGAPANQFVVSSGQGVFEQNGKSYQPVNLVTVDAQGNVSPSGTFNVEKNELSTFNQVVGGAAKIAAIAGSAYAIGSSLLNAAGLGGTAAGTAAASSADAAFVGEMASQLAQTGIGQAQIAQTLVASGVGAEAAAAAAAAAAGGASAGTIAGSLAAGNLFTATAADLAAAGITSGGVGTSLTGAATGGTTAGTAAGGTSAGSSLGGGITAGEGAGATLGTGGAASGGTAGGVAGGTGLTVGAGGTGAAAATTGGIVGSTGLITGNTAVDLATGAITGANAAGGALSLNALSQLFPTGLGSTITSGLSGLTNAITGQGAANAASNTASTLAKLGAAGPLINALVSGGLTQNEINNLKTLGEQAQKDYRTLATEASKDVSFTPYGVSTGLFSTTRPTTTGTYTSALSTDGKSLFDAATTAAESSFTEAGKADLNQMAADRMALYQQLVGKEQQRSRLAQEARLQAQGRLGVGAGGGEYAPELRALEDAIAKQNLQFALAAPQEALAQRGALITQGQAAGQLPLSISQQQLSALQLGGQLGQQQAQTAYQRGGLFGQYAGQGISENILAQIAAAQVASERNKAIGTALGGLFV